MENNKKTLVLSILGVLVLVVAVVGVSFAMYSFTGTGTKENVIQTGTVNVEYTNETSVLKLTNQYPISDAKGSAITAAENESATLAFSVKADIKGTITINYDLALDEVKQGKSLTDEYIKFNMTKDGEYKLGTAATGITVNSRKANVGTLATTGYLLDSDTFTASGEHKYVVRAWVSDQYDLPTTDTSTGDTHANETDSETFTFKVKVVAAQA